MQYREIGTSGIQASVVAVGAWAMGGWMWGGTNKDESIKAIHAALDGGVNFIDTAPIYGFGLSEEIVGAAIRGRRDKVVVATKCGMVCSPDAGEFKFNATAQGIDPDGHIPVSIYQGRDSIRKEVESSLRRLKTDYIDVLQTHWQDGTTPISETMETLLELKREGKIRAIGACNADTSQLSEYLEIGQLDSDQEKYSMLDRGMEHSQAPFCRERGISVFAYSPLANGLLTGNMSPDRKFAPGDLRADRPRFSVENRRAVLDMLAELQPIAEEKHISLVQLVTAWTVAGNGATHALCGMRNPAQAQENAAAGEVSFDESEIHAMNAVLERYGDIIR
jgi:aryl-alcohol dehydrogenase-like predicted oxidoreductase